jgi:hypothetical protein
MTTDQEAETVAASVRHLLTQRGIDARSWEAQSRQWESVAQQQKEEIATLAHAAHMPADYAYGLPSWINQVLYAAYIGADIGPHNRAWAVRLEDRWEAANEEVARLCAIIGTDTPIAALTLAATWHAEKSLYMERIAELEGALADLAELRRLARAVVASASHPTGVYEGTISVDIAALWALGRAARGEV